MRLQKFCSPTKAVVCVDIILLILVSSSNSGITSSDGNIVDEGDVTKAICDRITGLSKEQREICATHPDAMVAVGDGIHVAMNECQKQFHDHRWNCTIVGKRNSFGYIFLVGSREASFIYAITSAAITYTIASACSKGSINGCGCEINRKLKKRCKNCHNNSRISHSEISTISQNKNLWKWSGCSVNVDYAAKFTRKFLDAREVEGDARSLMNLHNNKVGRKAVKQNLKTDCKCHGMSGSCSLKTCWKTLPYFKVISNYLMDKYWQANGVTAIPISEARKLNAFRKSQKTNSTPNSLNIRLTKSVSKRFPKNTELVYLEPSPNYCEKDTLIGSLGTVGRTCNHSSTGMDGCDLMCCGRGYNIRQYTKQWQCRCKFYWCCYVTCDICTEKSEQYICK